MATVITPGLVSSLQQLQLERDGYANQLISIRRMLGITDTTVYTTAVLQQLLDSYNALKNAPPTPVPPLQPGAGGTVVSPTGFSGRSTNVDGFWKKTFEDDFPNLADFGQFLTTYGLWDAYPANDYTTNADPAKGGDGSHYSTQNLGVIDYNGVRAMACKLIPGTLTPDGKNWGCAPAPRFDIGYGSACAPTMKGEMRVCIPSPQDQYHAANLLWFDHQPWPGGGEDDLWEQDTHAADTDFIGAYFHNGGATASSDQRHFSTQVKPDNWHVIGWEHIAGKSYKQFLDGVQVKPDDGGDDASGSILNRVPSGVARLVLQNEPKQKGKPTLPMTILYDWITIWTPA